MTFEELVNKIDFVDYEDAGGICGVLELTYKQSDCDDTRRLYGVVEAVHNFIKDHFPQWYSGKPFYPIAHPTIENPLDAYNDNLFLCTDINVHIEYRARRQTILDKMKQIHHLFSIEQCPIVRQCDVLRYINV